MKKYHILIMLLIVASNQCFLCLGRCEGRDESEREIQKLHHKVDSLCVENEQLHNDVLFWKTKCELNKENYD